MKFTLLEDGHRLDSLMLCDIVGEPAGFCLRSGKVPVVMYKSTRCHISKDHRLCTHCRENNETLTTIVLSFDVLLTVHFSIILAINQLNAQNLLL